MPRVECPACGTPDTVPDRDLGKEVECRRCRTGFVAEEVAPPSDRPVARPDGSGAAVSSLLLGVASVPTAVCCGAGLMFALGGLVTGFGGLQSRRRGVAVFGMVLSAAGLALSIGVMTPFAVSSTAAQKEVPPKPDGTHAPFARGMN